MEVHFENPSAAVSKFHVPYFMKAKDNSIVHNFIYIDFIRLSSVNVMFRIYTSGEIKNILNAISVQLLKGMDTVLAL